MSKKPTTFKYKAKPRPPERYKSNRHRVMQVFLQDNTRRGYTREVYGMFQLLHRVFLNREAPIECPELAHEQFCFSDGLGLALTTVEAFLDESDESFAERQKEYEKRLADWERWAKAHKDELEACLEAQVEAKKKEMSKKISGLESSLKAVRDLE